MCEFLYCIEKAEPQILSGDMLQQLERTIVRRQGSYRPGKNSPAVAENEMPLPLRWVSPG